MFASRSRPSTPPSARRRRVARVLVAGPAVLASWAVMVGLPMAPAAAEPGHLVAETVALTGPDAPPTAAAGSPERSAPRPASSRAGQGWSARVSVAPGTQLVTLSWRGSVDGAVQVRGRTGGLWSEWTTAAAEPADGPDTGGNGRSGVGPVWLGHDGVDQVELRLLSGSLTEVVLDAMRWQPPSDGGPGVDRTPRAVARPTIRPRSEWAPGGWRGDLPGCASAPPVMSSLKFAVVHHTVDSNAYGSGDVPGILAAIYRYETTSLGWCDMAYNFLVDRFGRTWQGRSGDPATPVMSGATKGFNTSSVSVSLLGQFEPGASPAVGQPATAAMDAVRSVIAWKLALHGVNPTGTVRVQSNGSTRYPAGTWVDLPTIAGHRDTNLTACPGSNVYVRLPNLRTGVAMVIAAGGPPRWTPFASADAMVAQQFRDILRRSGSGPEIAWWTTRFGDGTTPGGVAAGMLDSPEAARSTGPLVRLYLSFFQRAPDHGGLEHWLGQLAAGTGITDIGQAFARSSEFTARYGALTNAGYVGRVYANVLARTPDPAGATYWNGRLAQGTSRGEVMVQFSESSEHVARSRNRVLLTSTFEAMLRRAVDPGAADHFGRALASGTMSLTQLADAVYASAEYRQRF